MAGTTRVARATGMADSTLNVTRLEYNKLVDDVEVLRAGLNLAAVAINAIITGAATNLAAVAAVTPVVRSTYDVAADLLAAKVADQTGNTTG